MRGPETEKSHEARRKSGFYSKYMSGSGLDIGYRGELKAAEPVLSSAIGIELDYPGYDGRKLPFPDKSQDYVFTSHVLEHISDSVAAIQEWYRVLKVGGHLILIVPHQYLYEKRLGLPSRFNEDHKIFFTPGKLLTLIEGSLPPNHWRLRHLRDNDDEFNYSIPPLKHSRGAYEIECVLQRIVPPDWTLE